MKKIYPIMGLAIMLFTLSAQGQTAKPNPYEGVSRPPANDPILANDDPAANPPAQTPAANTATHVAPAEDNANSALPVAMNTTPTLASRPAPAPADPDAEIVLTVPSKPNQLPEGTMLRVMLDQQLSTTTTLPGAPFSARIAENVTKNGRVVIPMGATVIGRVLSVSEGRRFLGSASIRLRPDEIDLPDGTRYFLHAEVYDINSRNNKTDSEGNIVSTDNGKRTLAEGALMSGGGAAAGALIAGVPGALIGAAAGAGFVTAHWLLANHQAVLPKNSEVVFGLTEPMSLVPLHD
ncbi:MAG TPA: hypothetical protein VHX63_06395 [Acidobacteriaceae bacterium]|nr:hypothetical protein [Acidobacteriaceae bacterium]